MKVDFRFLGQPQSQRAGTLGMPNTLYVQIQLYDAACISRSNLICVCYCVGKITVRRKTSDNDNILYQFQPPQYSSKTGRRKRISMHAYDTILSIFLTTITCVFACPPAVHHPALHGAAGEREKNGTFPLCQNRGHHLFPCCRVQQQQQKQASLCFWGFCPLISKCSYLLVRCFLCRGRRSQLGK